LGLAYADFNSLLNCPEQPTQLVSYDPRGMDRRPAGNYLVGTEQCEYGETGELPRRMIDYAQENDLELCGPPYMVYLYDAACVTTPEDSLLQIAVEVKTAA
jgi:hypothetical protein